MATNPVLPDSPAVVHLKAGKRLTVTVPTGGEAFVERIYSDVVIESALIAEEEELAFGEYLIDMAFRISAVSGSVSYAETQSTAAASPMVAPGDIVIGGADGVATRLAPGEEGDVLTIVDGVPAWVTPGP